VTPGFPGCDPFRGFRVEEDCRSALAVGGLPRSSPRGLGRWSHSRLQVMSLHLRSRSRLVGLHRSPPWPSSSPPLGVSDDLRESSSRVSHQQSYRPISVPDCAMLPRRLRPHQAYATVHPPRSREPFPPGCPEIPCSPARCARPVSLAQCVRRFLTPPSSQPSQGRSVCVGAPLNFCP
jgi:hypothetical protein